MLYPLPARALAGLVALAALSAGAQTAGAPVAQTAIHRQHTATAQDEIGLLHDLLRLDSGVLYDSRIFLVILFEDVAESFGCRMR